MGSDEALLRELGCGDEDVEKMLGTNLDRLFEPGT
jgi:hypothetical protein